MAFRERVAWISLAGIVAFAAYVATQVTAHPELAGDHGAFVGLIITAAVLQAIIAIIASVVVAVVDRRAAQARPDERDKLIDLKAARVAYMVLLLGMFGIVWAFLAGVSVFALTLSALGAVAAAEGVRFASQIVHYRFGA